jgi:hypothetical protein
MSKRAEDKGRDPPHFDSVRARYQLGPNTKNKKERFSKHLVVGRAFAKQGPTRQPKQAEGRKKGRKEANQSEVKRVKHEE